MHCLLPAHGGRCVIAGTRCHIRSSSAVAAALTAAAAAAAVVAVHYQQQQCQLHWKQQLRMLSVSKHLPQSKSRVLTENSCTAPDSYCHPFNQKVAPRQNWFIPPPSPTTKVSRAAPEITTPPFISTKNQPRSAGKIFYPLFFTKK